MDGHAKRERALDYRAAWMVCYIVNPWVKKRLTPNRILGRSVSWDDVGEEEFLQMLKDQKVEPEQ